MANPWVNLNEYWLYKTIVMTSRYRIYDNIQIERVVNELIKQLSKNSKEFKSYTEYII